MANLNIIPRSTSAQISVDEVMRRWTAAKYRAALVKAADRHGLYRPLSSADAPPPASPQLTLLSTG